MHTARVFSSLLYQTLMVLAIQKKTLQEPLQKTLAHKARRTPHGDHTGACHSTVARDSARTRARGSWSPAAVPAAETAVRELLLVGECGGGGPSARRVPRARRRRLSDSGRVSDPQDCSTSMRARAEGGRQVWAYIATMRAEVRSVL